MGWFRRSALAALIAGALVLVLPVPAQASALPSPVDPVPGLPSDYASKTNAGSSSFTNWATTAAGGKTINGFTLDTPAATFLRSGSAAQPLGTAFGIGFGIGSTGLRAWALSTGGDPLPGICGSGNGALRFGAAVMYPDLMPDCQGTIDETNRNLDQVLNHEARVVGFGTVKIGRGSGNYNSDPPHIYTSGVCGPNTPLATNRFWRLIHANGSTGGLVWQSTQGTYTAAACAPFPRYYETYMGADDPGFRIARVQVVEQEPGGQPVVLAEAEMKEGRDDPERRISCRLSWSDGSSSTSYGGYYRESTGVPMSGTGLGCSQAFATAGGRTPTRVQVFSSDGSAETPLADQPFLPNDGRLELFKSGASCMTWAADCAGWWDATSQGTVPGPYSCTFNGEGVALSECSVYRYTFDDPSAECPSIFDPFTNASAPWCADSGDGGDGGPTPGDDCFGESTDGLNPLQVIFKPVECGLLSLFMPRMEVVQSAFDAAAGKWADTMPGQLGPLVTETFTPPEGMSGCEGPRVYIPLSQQFDGWVDVDWTPLSACAEPQASIAAFSRVMSGAILVMITAFGIVRRISSSVNAPGVG